MENQLILIITFIPVFFLYTIILWQISKKQKLVKQNFKTSLQVIGIAFVISYVLFLMSLLIVLPTIMKIFIWILTFILIPFLIKKFYQTNWWKAIKIYLLIMLFAFLVMFGIFFIITFLTVIITPFIPH